MKIIKRYKNNVGVTVGYLVKDGRKNIRMSATDVIKNKEHITNAILMKSGEFRAKDGYKIDTELDKETNKSLIELKKGVVGNTNQLQIENKKFHLGIIDYYGRGRIEECIKIRKYALSGKLEVENIQHSVNGGRNTNLFNLIQACGVNVNDFIRAYLSVLQPYSLEKFQGNRTDVLKTNIWLVDIGYGYTFLIKIDTYREDRPIVVSFHESNRNGIYKVGAKDFSDKKCAVLVDNVDELKQGYKVRYTIQRGFIQYNVISLCEFYKDGVALVDYRDIKSELELIMRNVYRRIEDTYYDNKEEIISRIDKIDTSRLSFMSIGFTSVNNLCLAIDLYSRYTDRESRTVLVQIASSIINEMPDIKRIEVYNALEIRFEKERNKNKLYDAVIGLLK